MTATESGPERRLIGVTGADGIAVGPVYTLLDVDVSPDGSGGPDEQARARAALATVSERLGQASERLRAAGRTDDADMLDASQLMADDPTLQDEVEALAATMPAAAALLQATERQADLLAAIPDAYLAARAADVRRIGRQAARLAAADTPSRVEPGSHARETGEQPGTIASVVLVARDLGPADFAEIELDGPPVGGFALANGSVTSHAAIMARALGVPLVVGMGEAVLSLPAGAAVVLDGTAGTLTAAPSAATLQATQAAVQHRRKRRARLALERAAPAVTLDGHAVRLLVNASTEREVLAGLEAEAEGVGLLRTEFRFLDAAGWPTAAEHAAAVQSVVQHLAGRVATVRTLDFGADKTPPFLRGRSERGIAMHLTAPGALEAQFQGLLQAGADTGADLRIMLPLVEGAEQLRAARTRLQAAHAARSRTTPQPLPPPRVPPLGAMIETRAAVAAIDALAAAADFLSIGTNDLVQDVLGLDRLGQAATVSMAADPRVLRAIRAVTEAAQRHGRSVEVCGEAAGDPRIALLLIGLGVTELSVAPPSLDELRATVRAATLARLTALADAALRLDSADTVLALVG